MLSKVVSRIRQDGLSTLVNKVLDRVIRKLLYSRVDVLYLSLTTPPPLKDTELEIYTCDFDEFKAWANEHPRLTEQLPLAERRFNSGHICYIGKMPDGRLGHIIWATKGNELSATYETGESCKKILPNTVGIVIDAWTPDYARGRNYYAQVMTKTMYDLAVEFGEVWAWVDTRNAPSIKGFKKTGFIPRFVMGRKQFLGGLMERTYEFEATEY